MLAFPLQKQWGLAVPCVEDCRGVCCAGPGLGVWGLSQPGLHVHPRCAPDLSRDFSLTGSWEEGMRSCAPGRGTEQVGSRGHPLLCLPGTRSIYDWVPILAFIKWPESLQMSRIMTEALGFIFPRRLLSWGWGGVQLCFVTRAPHLKLQQQSLVLSCHRGCQVTCSGDQPPSVQVWRWKLAEITRYPPGSHRA